MGFNQNLNGRREKGLEFGRVGHFHGFHVGWDQSGENLKNEAVGRWAVAVHVSIRPNSRTLHRVSPAGLNLYVKCALPSQPPPR